MLKLKFYSNFNFKYSNFNNLNLLKYYKFLYLKFINNNIKYKNKYSSLNSLNSKLLKVYLFRLKSKLLKFDFINNNLNQMPFSLFIKLNKKNNLVKFKLFNKCLNKKLSFKNDYLLNFKKLLFKLFDYSNVDKNKKLNNCYNKNYIKNSLNSK